MVPGGLMWTASAAQHSSHPRAGDYAMGVGAVVALSVDSTVTVR